MVLWSNFSSAPIQNANTKQKILRKCNVSVGKFGHSKYPPPALRDRLKCEAFKKKKKKISSKILFVNKTYCFYWNFFRFLNYYPIFMTKFDFYRKIQKKYFCSNKSMFFSLFFWLPGCRSYPWRKYSPKTFKRPVVTIMKCTFTGLIAMVISFSVLKKYQVLRLDLFQ